MSENETQEERYDRELLERIRQEPMTFRRNRGEGDE